LIQRDLGVSEHPIDASRRSADGHRPIEVLFEDNHLLAINKPAGLLTQDSGRGEDSAEERARRYVKETRNKPGTVFLHVAHRLDREASGIVLCATTSKALARLNEQMRARSVRKLYHAVVELPTTGRGEPPAEHGELVDWLAHDDHRARIAAAGTVGAQECRMCYRVLARGDGIVVLEIDLKTGRYHQIRAQLAAAGWPILGDRRYGGPPCDMAGIALHHVRLELEHPVRRTPLVLEAAHPDTWPGHWPARGPRQRPE